VERISTEAPRWSWKGEWRRDNRLRISDATGAEATVSFQGTGAILTGLYSPKGGQAEVYLDGKKDRVVDVYPDEDAAKNGEGVWHAFGLQNGKHTVRLVVLGKPYPGSKGAEISLQDLIEFR
jgi:hypothetical protein